MGTVAAVVCAFVAGDDLPFGALSRLIERNEDEGVGETASEFLVSDGDSDPVCVADINEVSAVAGVRTGEVGDAEDNVDLMRRAGLGKVLYVDPREVYPSS